jgi:hypothetical protein
MREYADPHIVFVSRDRQETENTFSYIKINLLK